MLLSGTSLSVPYGTNLTPLMQKLSSANTTSGGGSGNAGGSINTAEPILNKTRTSIISR